MHTCVVPLHAAAPLQRQFVPEHELPCSALHASPPALQRHVPEKHPAPDAQAPPQAPQWLVLDEVSTHEPPQQVVPPPHTLHAEPQEAERGTHPSVPQHVSSMPHPAPPLHRQLPPTHVSPGRHWRPHEPQLLGSLDRLTQPVGAAQQVWPELHAEPPLQRQLPLEHVSPATHWVVQLPQCMGSLPSVAHPSAQHTAGLGQAGPLARVVPLHVQPPLPQLSSESHELPQERQLEMVLSAAQLPLQQA